MVGYRMIKYNESNSYENMSRYKQAGAKLDQAESWGYGLTKNGTKLDSRF